MIKLETYDLDCLCGNCGTNQTVHVPVGKHAGTFLRNKLCPKCDTFNLFQIYSKITKNNKQVEYFFDARRDQTFVREAKKEKV